MRIDYPLPDQLPELRNLWKEAFGDSDAYLDLFFGTGYSPTRCRCLTEDGHVAAALYWLDLFCDGQKMAYIYAVATGKAYRGRGLCRMLMEDTRNVLRGRGYYGAVLSPGDAGLARMYGTMGYSYCANVGQIRCQAGGKSVAIQRVSAEVYNAQRNVLLPEGGLELGKAAAGFLAAQAELYVGENCTLAALRTEEGLFGIELLGNAKLAPDILKTLDCETGVFRIPFGDHPFAMFCLLKKKAKTPRYLGIAFD